MAFFPLAFRRVFAACPTKATAQALLLGALTILLAACAHGELETSLAADAATPATLTELNAVCCDQAEEYPRPLVAVADAAAPLFGRITRLIEFRRGYLDDMPDAQAHLRRQLRPLDMALITSDGRLSNSLLPGSFSHVAIYLGTEQDARRMGVWSDPRVVPHQTRIAGGGVFIEAVSGGVRLARQDEVFNADRIVLLRSNLRSTAERRAAIAHFYSHIGTPFDYHFDGSDESCLFCTELAEHVLPQLELEPEIIYDRPVLLPDQIILSALNGSPRLTFLDYVEAFPDHWESRSRQALIVKLFERWQRMNGADQPVAAAAL